MSTGSSKDMINLVATEDIKATVDQPVELWCRYGAYYWKNGKV